MVEPLKKEDIELGSFIWEKIQLDKAFLSKKNIELHLRQYVNVVRVREQVEKILEDIDYQIVQFIVANKPDTISLLKDFKFNIELGFGVLLQNQSPSSKEPDVADVQKDKPSQEQRDDVIKQPVGVNNRKK